jgi:hypothetical protein
MVSYAKSKSLQAVEISLWDGCFLFAGTHRPRQKVRGPAFSLLNLLWNALNSASRARIASSAACEDSFQGNPRRSTPVCPPNGHSHVAWVNDESIYECLELGLRLCAYITVI